MCLTLYCTFNLTPFFIWIICTFKYYTKSRLVLIFSLLITPPKGIWSHTPIYVQHRITLWWYPHSDTFLVFWLKTTMLLIIDSFSCVQDIWKGYWGAFSNKSLNINLRTRQYWYLFSCLQHDFYFLSLYTLFYFYDLVFKCNSENKFPWLLHPSSSGSLYISLVDYDIFLCYVLTYTPTLSWSGEHHFCACKRLCFYVQGDKDDIIGHNFNRIRLVSKKVRCWNPYFQYSFWCI